MKLFIAELHDATLLDIFRYKLPKLLEKNPEWKIIYHTPKLHIPSTMVNAINEAEIVVVDAMLYGNRFSTQLVPHIKNHPKSALYLSDIGRRLISYSKNFKFSFGEACYLLDDFELKPYCFLPHASPIVPFSPTRQTSKVLFLARHFQGQPIGSFFRNFYKKRIEFAKALKNCPDVTFQEKYVPSKEYPKLIQSYAACLTTIPSFRFSNIVAKFFEIPANGSLLLAGLEDKKEIFETLGFKDGVNYYYVTLENAKEKIEYILDPKHSQEVEKVRLVGYELVKNTSTVEKRLEEFLQMIEKEFL